MAACAVAVLVSGGEKSVRAQEPSGNLQPWSVSADAPVVREGDAAEAAGAADGDEPTSMARPVLLSMRFYSSVISEADGARCNMYPTCAAYAVRAVRKRGPILGGLLAADRLLHESGAGPGWYRTVRKYGRIRWLDPVSQNDFWLDSPEAPGPRAEAAER